MNFEIITFLSENNSAIYIKFHLLYKLYVQYVQEIIVNV